MALCAECTAASNKWLDSKPSQMVRPGIKIANNATYDMTPAGVRDNSRAAFEDWRQLVRRQMKLIADICRRDHQIENEEAMAA